MNAIIPASELKVLVGVDGMALAKKELLQFDADVKALASSDPTVTLHALIDDLGFEEAGIKKAIFEDPATTRLRAEVDDLGFEEGGLKKHIFQESVTTHLQAESMGFDTVIAQMDAVRAMAKAPIVQEVKLEIDKSSLAALAAEDAAVGAASPTAGAGEVATATAARTARETILRSHSGGGAADDAGLLAAILASAGDGGHGKGPLSTLAWGNHSPGSSGPWWMRAMMGGGKLAGAGSLGAFAGFGAEHFLFSGLGVLGSAGSAAAGAGLMAGGALATQLVGGGADMAVSKSTISDTEQLSEKYKALQQAVLLYGHDSKQAAKAAAELHLVEKQEGPAGKAELELAKSSSALGKFWTQQTQDARVNSTKVLEQVVHLGHDYTPLVAHAAEQNLSLVNKGLKPLFSWLEGPEGTGIFEHLEEEFQHNLPTAMDALDQGTQFVIKTLNVASESTGGFIHSVDAFFTKWNNPQGFVIWEGHMEHMIGDFHLWEGFLKELGSDVVDIFSQDAGSGEAIVSTLTEMLTHLHEWETSTEGKEELHNLFVVHKEEILSLLKVIPPLISSLEPVYMTIAPPMVEAMTEILNVVGGFLHLMDETGPVTRWALGLGLIGLKLGLLQGPLALLRKQLWAPFESLLAKDPLIGRFFEDQVTETDALTTATEGLTGAVDNLTVSYEAMGTAAAAAGEEAAAVNVTSAGATMDPALAERALGPAEVAPLPLIDDPWEPDWAALKAQDARMRASGSAGYLGTGAGAGEAAAGGGSAMYAGTGIVLPALIIGVGGIVAKKVGEEANKISGHDGTSGNGRHSLLPEIPGVGHFQGAEEILGALGFGGESSHTGRNRANSHQKALGLEWMKSEAELTSLRGHFSDTMGKIHSDAKQGLGAIDGALETGLHQADETWQTGTSQWGGHTADAMHAAVEAIRAGMRDGTIDMSEGHERVHALLIQMGVAVGEFSNVVAGALEKSDAAALFEASKNPELKIPQSQRQAIGGEAEDLGRLKSGYVVELDQIKTLLRKGSEENAKAFQEGSPEWRAAAADNMHAAIEAIKTGEHEGYIAVEKGNKEIAALLKEAHLVTGNDPFGIAHSFVSSWEKAGGANRKGIASQISELGQMPPKMRAIAVQMELEQVRHAEQTGALVKGSYGRLRSAVVTEFGLMALKAGEQAQALGVNVVGPFGEMNSLVREALEDIGGNTSQVLEALGVTSLPQFHLKTGQLDKGLTKGDQSAFKAFGEGQGHQTGGFTVPGNSTGDNHPYLLPHESFIMNREATAAHGLQKGGMSPVVLESGERVFTPPEVAAVGAQKLEWMNSSVPRFQHGGMLGPEPQLQGPKGAVLGLGDAAIHTGYTAAQHFLQAHGSKGRTGTGGTINISGLEGNRFDIAAEEVRRAHAPHLAILALFEALIDENGPFSNVLEGEGAGVGAPIMSAAKEIAGFLTGTPAWTGNGSAIGLARMHPKMPAYEIAQIIQASGAGASSMGRDNYGTHQAEAEAMMRRNGFAEGGPVAARGFADDVWHALFGAVGPPAISFPHRREGETADTTRGRTVEIPTWEIPFLVSNAGAGRSSRDWVTDDVRRGLVHEFAHVRQNPEVWNHDVQAEGGASWFSDLRSSDVYAALGIPFHHVESAYPSQLAYVKAHYDENWVLSGQFKPLAGDFNHRQGGGPIGIAAGAGGRFDPRAVAHHPRARLTTEQQQEHLAWKWGAHMAEGGLIAKEEARLGVPNSTAASEAKKAQTEAESKQTPTEVVHWAMERIGQSQPWDSESPGEWCGDFLADDMRVHGLPVPSGYALAENWGKASYGTALGRAHMQAGAVIDYGGEHVALAISSSEMIQGNDHDGVVGTSPIVGSVGGSGITAVRWPEYSKGHGPGAGSKPTETVPGEFKGAHTKSLSLGSSKVPKTLHGIAEEMHRWRGELQTYEHAAHLATGRPKLQRALQANVTRIQKYLRELERARHKLRNEEAKKHYSHHLAKQLGKITGEEKNIELAERGYETAGQYAEQVVALEPTEPTLQQTPEQVGSETEKAYEVKVRGVEEANHQIELNHLHDYEAFVEGRERPAYEKVLGAEADWRNTILGAESKATGLEANWEVQIHSDDVMIAGIPRHFDAVKKRVDEWQKKNPKKALPTILGREWQDAQYERSLLPELRFQDGELRKALGEARQEFYPGFPKALQPPQPPLPGSGSFEQSMQEVQGIHWPGQHEHLAAAALAPPRHAGSVGGAIWDTQTAIEELGLNVAQAQAGIGSVAGSGAGSAGSSTSAAESERTQLLEELLRQANERAAIGEVERQTLNGAHILPYAGGYESGGMVAALVGEQGPEIVATRPGAYIRTAAETSSLLSPKVVVNHYEAERRTEVEINDEKVEAVINRMQRRGARTARRGLARAGS